jgi:hypothetical protein
LIFVEHDLSALCGYLNGAMNLMSAIALCVPNCQQVYEVVLGNFNGL